MAVDAGFAHYVDGVVHLCKDLYVCACCNMCSFVFTYLDVLKFFCVLDV